MCEGSISACVVGSVPDRFCQHSLAFMFPVHICCDMFRYLGLNVLDIVGCMSHCS